MSKSAKLRFVLAQRYIYIAMVSFSISATVDADQTRKKRENK